MDRRIHVISRAFLIMCVIVGCTYAMLYLGQIVYSAKYQKIDILKLESVPPYVEEASDPYHDQLYIETEKIRFEKDPFYQKPKIVPVVIPEPEKPKELMLQGILWGGEYPQAVINGQIVNVGDKVVNSTVVEIGVNAVTLIKDDPDLMPDQRTLILRLPGAIESLPHDSGK